MPFYEFSMKLWEGLEQDINYNAMVSQRGVLNLYHSDGQRDAYARRGNAMRMHGVDAELLDRDQVRAMLPFLDFDNARFPIQGGLLQKRGGTARHDAVAWGYARAADRRGVDIIQNCEVTGLMIDAEANSSASKRRAGRSGRGKSRLPWPASSSRLAAMAGLRLPIESHVLQAFVSEGLKPLIDTVVTFGAGHFYVSQSDKGGLVFGGDIDGYNSYAQRGNLPVVEDVCEGGMALCRRSAASRPAPLGRHHGYVDGRLADHRPHPVRGLYLNAGWCYGGFKATPASGWCFAHLIARDESHEVAAAYRLDRFATGHLIDEKGVGAQPNLH